jgi:hypothetical protein
VASGDDLFGERQRATLAAHGPPAPADAGEPPRPQQTPFFDGLAADRRDATANEATANRL